MKQWEYHVGFIGNHDSPAFKTLLSKMGREGWEMVALEPSEHCGSRQSRIAYFKRELPQDPPHRAGRTRETERNTHDTTN